MTTEYLKRNIVFAVLVVTPSGFLQESCDPNTFLFIRHRGGNKLILPQAEMSTVQKPRKILEEVICPGIGITPSDLSCQSEVITLNGVRGDTLECRCAIGTILKEPTPHLNIQEACWIERRNFLRYQKQLMISKLSIAIIERCCHRGLY